MTAVSHRRSTGRGTRTVAASKTLDVATLLRRLSARLQRARLYYGHGTDNARDDAAALIWHVMQLPREADERIARRRVTATHLAALEPLVQRRIRERVPVVYLTQRCWFAGLEMYVDERVLIPRSPIAELIERGFAPWVDPPAVRRVVDIGTGSGCIAIACAVALPRAQVDAVDISPAALEVTRLNIRRHRLGQRVRPVLSDHFSALGQASYDIIVSNPPYVGRREMASLPAEYRHEPELALASGPDGLDSVRVLLAQAAQRLRPRGILVVEVGNSERALRRAFPKLPFTWLEFERGGGGVFVLTREQLEF
ncbi:MAG: 50S ribosomal protein L3 N(5)-glutamine methyltransferase [Steroidobacteraceae bacterium]